MPSWPILINDDKLSRRNSCMLKLSRPLHVQNSVHDVYSGYSLATTATSRDIWRKHSSHWYRQRPFYICWQTRVIRHAHTLSYCVQCDLLAPANGHNWRTCAMFSCCSKYSDRRFRIVLDGQWASAMMVLRFVTVAVTVILVIARVLVEV